MAKPSSGLHRFLQMMFFFAFVFMTAYGLMNIVVGVIVRDALVQGRQNKASSKTIIYRALDCANFKHK